MTKPVGTRIITGLIASLLVLRAVLLCTALANPERAFFGNDPLVHARIARNLVERGLFSDHEAPPFVANINRTPLYPLLVALAFRLAGERYVGVMIVLQNALAVFTALGFAQFVRARAGPRAASICLLLLVADLPNIFVSNFLLTEIVYVALAGLSFVMLTAALERRQRALGQVALAGVLAALAALCRPIHLYLPVVLAAAGLMTTRNKPRRLVGPLALYLLIFCAGMSPWFYRNFRTYGKPQLTHLSAVHFYLYKAGGALAVAEGRDFDEIEAELERKARDEFGIDNMSEDPREEALLDYGWRTIRKHPRAFLVSTLKGAIVLVAAPDKGKLSWLLGRPAPQFGLAFGRRRDLGDAMGRLRTTLSQLAWPELGSIVVQLLVVFLAYGLILRGVYAGALRFSAPLVVLALCAAGYYILLPAGPEVQGRFRVPAWPYVAILASLSLGGRSIVPGRPPEQETRLRDETESRPVTRA